MMEREQMGAFEERDGDTASTRGEQRGSGPKSAKAESGAVEILDISQEFCPMTWVRTRVALERCSSGELLHVILGPGEMVRNIPQNVRDEGHTILSFEAESEDRHRLVIRRK